MITFTSDTGISRFYHSFNLCLVDNIALSENNRNLIATLIATCDNNRAARYVNQAMFSSKKYMAFISIGYVNSYYVNTT